MNHRTPNSALLTATLLLGWAIPSMASAPLPFQGQPDPDGTETSEELEEWATLDHELRSLESLEYSYESNAKIWGYGRVNFFVREKANSAGVNLDNARVNLTGSTGMYAYRVTAELRGGPNSGHHHYPTALQLRRRQGAPYPWEPLA